MDEPISQVIGRLIDRLTDERRPDPPPTASEAKLTTALPDTAVAKTPLVVGQWLAIYKVYKGHRIEGAFNPSTHEVRLSTPPWGNRFFTSPTAAAVAVVDHFSSEVRETLNTNGRKFWKLASNGKDLRSVIGERP